MIENAVEVVGTFDATMDHLFVVKEAAFGFLPENKDSPYPWMLAIATAANALPLALVFFGVGMIESGVFSSECARLVSC